MSRLANAKPGGDGPVAWQFAWLAGLLEAEGTFLRPPPSMPNRPIVSCRMTDRDVVDRAAKLFGVRTLAINKGRYRTEYAATLKGARAVALMRDIKPMMGSRRQTAIAEALSCYLPPKRKLNFAAAEEIRRRYAAGESISALAHSYNVTRQTIRPILRGDLYGAPQLRPWTTDSGLRFKTESSPGLSSAELFWLAGWLEGEGSFLPPPPSKPRCARISAQAKDADVVADVGRLFRVKPIFDRSGLSRNASWSPMWRVLVQGRRAVALMLACEPLMGERRSIQIRTAVEAAARAQKTASLSMECAV